jgi:hypothetical protein
MRKSYLLPSSISSIAKQILLQSISNRKTKMAKIVDVVQAEK